jgi:hypothetical protein
MNRAKTEDQTCGEELAADAEVPERWRDLARHVAHNMEAHARRVDASAPGVGPANAAAQRERDGLLRVARAYREMADAADRAAEAMRAMRDAPAAPPDPARRDPAALARWMTAKVALQRELATILLRHADASERLMNDARQ